MRPYDFCHFGIQAGTASAGRIEPPKVVLVKLVADSLTYGAPNPRPYSICTTTPEFLYEAISFPCLLRKNMPDLRPGIQSEADIKSVVDTFYEKVNLLREGQCRPFACAGVQQLRARRLARASTAPVQFLERNFVAHLALSRVAHFQAYTLRHSYWHGARILKPKLKRVLQGWQYRTQY
ncbi:hypothetical protein SAMN04515668_0754 [Hymenobacter arizonensis]|uniref:Uncharacterized protein n=2 Tax=Hymenobacter arizonensis TaxID=1227077 RepID=A0A1I5U441_HYMAR|nr:hypothetical protein SAMN04515668_0754 [Hymenobacter arizonensis]